MQAPRSAARGAALAAGTEGVPSRDARPDETLSGLTAPTILSPRDQQELLSCVNTARSEGLALVVTGGGTAMGAATPPRALDLLLSTRGLGGRVDARPNDMVVTIGAGATLTELNRTLAASGQRLPLDPPLAGQATLGGLVAADTTCSSSAGFGCFRDMVLGLNAIDGSGRELTVGGQVVKNVAGYDLVRLLAGSNGSLAIITQLTLRTFPRPVAALTLQYRLADTAAAVAARASLLNSELSPVMMDLLQDGDKDSTGGSPDDDHERPLLLLRIEGGNSELDYQLARLRELLGCAPLARSDNPPDHHDALHLGWLLRLRAISMPGQALAFADRIATLVKAGGSYQLLTHLCSGETVIGLEPVAA
ncbi:MAG: FAD-binding protein, partial [Candidatus Poseidoniia archaeon]|nr:FAD-binding protein [Candidatus Poseidoniia archaeon]